jgi:hypothetical protein
MNIQELEEMEFNEGRATELQNLFSQSKGETTISKVSMETIKEHTARGNSVVVQHFEKTCVWTDALIGVSSEIVLITGLHAIARQYEDSPDFSVYYGEK